MPHPKRRHSRSRRNKRRSHDRLQAPAMSICPNCQAVIRPHIVCRHCGHYKGRQVIEVRELG